MRALPQPSSSHTKQQCAVKTQRALLSSFTNRYSTERVSGHPVFYWLWAERLGPIHKQIAHSLAEIYQTDAGAEHTLEHRLEGQRDEALWVVLGCQHTAALFPTTEHLLLAGKVLFAIYNKQAG